MEWQKETFNKIKIKQIPITKDEIQSFKYRIENIVGSLTYKQVMAMN